MAEVNGKNVAFQHPGYAQYQPFQTTPDEEVAFQTADLLVQKPATSTVPLRERLLHDPRAQLRALLAISSVALLVLAVAQVGLTLQNWQAEPPMFGVECMTPLGGGAVMPGGSFPHFEDSWCKPQVQMYFDKHGGVYYREVERVASNAIAYLDQLQASAPLTPQQVFVFDIDETTLSNVVEWMGAGGILGDGDKSQRHQQQQALLDAAALKGQQASDRPPLEAVRSLYLWLYAHNASVAFITGRKESGRQATAANLAAAGYGNQCPASPDGGLPLRTPEPCYVRLMLREEDDDRLASVYKPDKRGELQADGFTLLGNIGDQMSDLDGLHSAPASFKLPNPVYYII